MKNTIFALNDNTPKYKQIYEQFKFYMENGNISVNEQLPSIRQLADSLSVSRNTTLNAYEQLLAEGYIRSDGRKGYFVNDLDPLLYQSAKMPIKSEKKELRDARIDFRAGTVDQEHFPLKNWRRLTNQVLTLQHSFQYGDPFGEECLREQIAAYLFQSRGLKTNANNIIISSGTQQMLINLGKILRENFSSFIVEDPGYVGAREALKFHDFTLETVPVFETGTDFSNLNQKKSRLIYVTPSHQSPIGVSMSIQERLKLINWASARQGFIIEDDYDSEFRYTQQPFPALASIDLTRVIYFGNFSKSFLPGIRISYMVLPELLINQYKKQFSLFECPTSLLNQIAMAKFMKDGEWNRHLKRMRLVYNRKMNYIVSELKSQFKQTITIIGEQSGLFVLVKLRLNRSEEWLINQASLYGVAVYPTSIYTIENHMNEPTIKLGFSNLTCEEIQLGVQLLKEAWT
ncbi:PLP-dependent aminotransferase family protein [Niallia taxi]|uniref:MocR-like pyridoxine biosynthesis transcription factor PdxR n=1 Tax=Niallia taxi TaxID=2499688 RepID=UPI0030081C98